MEKTILIFLLLILFISIYTINSIEREEILTLDQIYDKNSKLSTVEYVHGVPKVVYIVWFGRKISQNRLQALNSLIKNIKVPYILITEDNYKNFEVEDHPIHPAFKYLSGNHQSDYLRAYLLHHYGGSYHDIKYRDRGWSCEWEDFKDENIWMKSSAEIQPDHVGYDLDHPETKSIQKEYRSLGSMCWIISRKRTKYTQELLEKIDQKLDLHHSKLKHHPSVKPAGYYADRPMEKLHKRDKYPLRWLELMGEHYHLLMYKYKDHMLLNLPRPNLKNYR